MIISLIHSFLWGVPGLCVIIGIGIYLSVVTGFPQVRFFFRSVRRLFRNRNSEKNEGSISPFQALCTALAATVGTGNLIGVAGAICLGGPGAVFWMWVCGFIGMATKFAEVTLAVRYRIQKGNDYFGGPMYMISGGLGHRWDWLAKLYCFFGVIAAFGVGNTVQVNAIISGVNGILDQYGVYHSKAHNLFMGVIISIMVGAVLLGGVQRIGRTAEKLVPITAACYVMLCIILIIRQRSGLYIALTTIIKGAFHPKAFTGGIIGSTFRCMSVGCARGVFTNEAGMGTSSIAHASAEASHPVEQGIMGLLEVFIDTIVICSLTAFSILCSGVPIPYGKECGAALTSRAFSAVFGQWSSYFISFSLCAFAFATILGWGLYGARCGAYLWGQEKWKKLVYLQIGTIILGSILQTGFIWQTSEVMNGLMAVPNLLALFVLSPELVRLTKEFSGKM